MKIYLNAFAHVGEEHKAEIETKAAEIMRRGMECLTKQMGIVEAEQIISVII